MEEYNELVKEREILLNEIEDAAAYMRDRCGHYSDIKTMIELSRQIYDWSKELETNIDRLDEVLKDPKLIDELYSDY